MWCFMFVLSFLFDYCLLVQVLISLIFFNFSIFFVLSIWTYTVIMLNLPPVVVLPVKSK